MSPSRERRDASGRSSAFRFATWFDESALRRELERLKCEHQRVDRGASAHEAGPRLAGTLDKLSRHEDVVQTDSSVGRSVERSSPLLRA